MLSLYSSIALMSMAMWKICEVLEDLQQVWSIKKCLQLLQQIPYRVYTESRNWFLNIVQRYLTDSKKINLDISVWWNSCSDSWACQLWSPIKLRQLVLKNLKPWSFFLDCIISSDECAFHVSGEVNTHNARIWVTEHPYETRNISRYS